MAQLVSGPAVLDLVVYAGDSNAIGLELFSEQGPTDTTGATIAAQARAAASDTLVVAEAVITATDPVRGSHVMTWDGEALRAVLGGDDQWSGVWDLQVTWASATLPQTLLRGKFQVLHDVTRVVA